VICYAHSFVGVTDELFVPLFPCSKTTKLATKLASFSLHFWTQCLSNFPSKFVKNSVESRKCLLSTSDRI
jgi:hypothetical protein